eukprot:CAMPEP_0181033562 /NCGR_PEP_ID=MMETSP1070-20121207/7320_1 /TAXON_ID=265543 /ORGANISM="Minutocellus polymorphus, Strain NH13" /LENGTH=628 /DNA_ID=CAMNT_0023110991 /DNA_START=106 /DNA_END=1989 /DNA_ORIENTATION=+
MTPNNERSSQNDGGTGQPSQKKSKTTMSSTKRKRRRLPHDAKVAIVGSGMGGLSAALSLKLKGFTNVTVYERDAHFSERRDGYGLTLSYNEKGPLAKLGLLETAARVDCPSRSHYVFKPDGTILGYYGNAFHNVGVEEISQRRGLGQRGNLRIPRQVLRRIMLDELLAPSSSDAGADGKATVEWGKRLVSFEDRVMHMSGNAFTCDDDGNGQGAVQLTFEDGTTKEVDLLIGSDGIRSTVTRSFLSEGLPITESNSGLSYLGIMIVLGITDQFCHPLLDERGFYTLDGNNRLFTMPFEGSKLDDVLRNGTASDSKPARRYMWQLSWNEPDEGKARQLSQAGPNALIEEVKRRCQSWHEPVLDMVSSTSSENVWGTGLQDRDPEQLVSSATAFRSGGQSRVVVLGDAVHAMSCFKGQGANQALTDGPLLALWLEKSSIDSAIRGFMREMVARTKEKVRASREAAVFLHSPAVLDHSEDFAGVQNELVPQFLNTLAKKNICASLAEKLDSSIYAFLKEEEGKRFVSGAAASEQVEDENLKKKNEIFREQALNFAECGDSAGLRRLPPDVIHNALDSDRRTCLHLAALGGHYHACRYLITESLMSTDTKDGAEKTALHYARMSKDAQTAML